ncbi:MAG: carboxymuconolactone decarboxylase family protein [Planctomycetota bacterium]
MAWIEQVSEDSATGKLAEIYAAAAKRAGGVANILKVMSLRPQILEPFLEVYLRLMHGPGSLTPSERELLATVTSRVNQCVY